METIFRDKSGKPIYVLGLQAQNDANGCWEMIDESISAVKQFNGNTLEVPVCWYAIEPEEGKFDLSSVEELILRVRQSGLHLIILWFGSIKNCDITYMPEWAKKDTRRFKLLVGPDGMVEPIVSPHCPETFEADRKAFAEVMKCIKRVDEEHRTVIAVQVENECGLYPLDRCYSKKAQADFDLGVPPELDGVVIEDSEATGQGNGWIDRFGIHANEAFSAWHIAKNVNYIASAGKEIYPSMPLFTNTAIGEIRQEIGGQSYACGGPVGRMLEIWKRGAPHIDVNGVDNYHPCKKNYERICKTYSQHNNMLFLPETGTRGDSFAINHIMAAADYNAIGICGFGATSIMGSDGKLDSEAMKVADTMKIIRMMGPVLLKHGGTDKIFSITQEEYEQHRYVKREKYHVFFQFTTVTGKGHAMGNNMRVHGQVVDDPQVFSKRARAIVYEANPHEFFIAGVGFTAKFTRRAEPNDPYPRRMYFTRAATELAALTVEEGHFTEDGEWVCEFQRRGDEVDCGAFVYPGIVLRVKLNPNVCDQIDW